MLNQKKRDKPRIRNFPFPARPLGLYLWRPSITHVPYPNGSGPFVCIDISAQLRLNNWKVLSNLYMRTFNPLVWSCKLLMGSIKLIENFQGIYRKCIKSMYIIKKNLMMIFNSLLSSNIASWKPLRSCTCGCSVFSMLMSMPAQLNYLLELYKDFCT